jgi:hypothetical protein
MVNEGGDIGVELIEAAIDAALDRLVGEQQEPARCKVEVIALIAGELRLWRVAGTNDSFRLTPTIFGPKMDGGYGASPAESRPVTIGWSARREQPFDRHGDIGSTRSGRTFRDWTNISAARS